MLRKFKIFTAMVLMLLFMSVKTFAAMPDISSGSKQFDPFTMCYILKDNVKVVQQDRTITADRAVVKITEQKVWAVGDVTLSQAGLWFKCDKIFVQGLDNKVDVIGNLDFVQDGTLKITADVGTFSWKSKMADFYGHVKLNVDNSFSKKKINGLYDHVKYDIVNKKIIALDKSYQPIPKAEFSESDPVEGK